MTLHLRPARVTDLPGVLIGEQDYIRRWEPDHELTWRLQLERHLRCWTDNFDRLTVAEWDGNFAGYALWMAEGEWAVLCTLNVAEAFRRKGIGRALVAAFMTSAKDQGYPHLSLSVRADNPAMRLYERAGFICTGTDAHQYLTLENHLA
ncbi:GNAT family N-acetyltransferase [Pseudomonas zeae]|uniref:GNAT family N-acetyltransferase n=1 Tax=Pseudomonas zeae TaxID=2745510 RepID=UPI0039E06AD8